MTSFDLGVVPRLPAPATVELCIEAEALGFDGVWVADSQSVFRDAYGILVAVAARTEHVLLSTGVTNPVTRHPAVLAGAHATLAELAPGRVVITLGRGESAVQTIGLKAATLKRMEEAVLALRALLAGETARWNGAEIRMGYETERIPIYLTASGPKMLRLAGLVGDGVLFQVGTQPGLVEWALRQIEAGARESGRELSDLVLCARVGCCVGNDSAEARARMRTYAASAAKTVFDSVPENELVPELVKEVRALHDSYDYYQQCHIEAPHRELLTPGLVDAVAVAGTPDEVAERLSRIADFPLNRIVLTYAGADAAEQHRLLSRLILPVMH